MTTFELYRPDRDLTRVQLVAELAAMPQRLRALVGSLSLDALEHRGDDGSWSPLEVCRHMRDIAQVYGMRFKWMILDDGPFLPNYDENRWVAESPDGAANLEPMLHEIDAYRAETVRLLRSLDDAAWRRPGRHEVIGVVEL